VFFQDACLGHRFIRGNIDPSCIVERPERIRAVKLGVAAAALRLEEMDLRSGANQEAPGDELHPGPALDAISHLKPHDAADGLADALEHLNLAQASESDIQGSALPSASVSLVRSSASLDLLNHPAVKFIHGDVDGDVYLENLITWAKSSEDKIAQDESEVPEGYSQGDLYRACSYVAGRTDRHKGCSLSDLD
jgi:histone deacetylase HOS3